MRAISLGHALFATGGRKRGFLFWRNDEMVFQIDDFPAAGLFLRGTDGVSFEAPPIARICARTIHAERPSPVLRTWSLLRGKKYFGAMDAGSFGAGTETG